MKKGRVVAIRTLYAVTKVQSSEKECVQLMKRLVAKKNLIDYSPGRGGTRAREKHLPELVCIGVRGIKNSQQHASLNISCPRGFDLHDN